MVATFYRQNLGPNKDDWYYDDSSPKYRFVFDSDYMRGALLYVHIRRDNDSDLSEVELRFTADNWP
ncbi:MAG: hypothetical protein U0232_01200 [Thermomicrobiales bacterium]